MSDDTIVNESEDAAAPVVGVVRARTSYVLLVIGYLWILLTGGLIAPVSVGVAPPEIMAKALTISVIGVLPYLAVIEVIVPSEWSRRPLRALEDVRRCTGWAWRPLLVSLRLGQIGLVLVALFAVIAFGRAVVGLVFGG